MAARLLTDRFCESMKPIEGRQVAYPDTKSRGLELRVSGDGKKAWYFRYRTRDGAQRRLKVGDFPTLDLKRERDLTHVRRGEVAAGADPAGDGRLSLKKARAEPVKTFADLFDVYFAACSSGEWRPRKRNKKAATIDAERKTLAFHVLPAIGEAPIIFPRIAATNPATPYPLRSTCRSNEMAIGHVKTSTIPINMYGHNF